MTLAPIPWTANLVEGKDFDLTKLLASTKKLQMSTSVSSVYPYVEWIFNAPLTYLELGVFTIGQGIQFIFNEPKKEKQLSYVFYIDSISYSTASSDSSGPVTFTLVMSTKTLFADRVLDKGYYGNVADIITQMANEELLPSGAISSFQITKGIDSPMKRFRTYMTAQQFIDERLVDSFRGEQESFTYIFTDLEKKLYALHTLAAVDELERFYAYHPGYHDVTTIATLSEDSNIKHNISVFEAMNVSLNENRRLWQISNAGLVMMNRTNTAKAINEFPVFRMFPPMNPNEKEMFPISSNKPKSYDQLTEVYIQDDENDYSKSFTAFSFNRNASILNSMKITLSVEVNLNIKAGHILTLYPPSYKDSTPFIASIFEGNWLITEASHVLQGPTGRTYLTLQTTALRQRKNREMDSKYYRQE